jgi:tetratricopeptide (TPR) repeat protein
MMTMTSALCATLLLVSFGVTACGGGATARRDPSSPSAQRAEPTVKEKKAAAVELYRLGQEQRRIGDTLRAEEYFASALDSGGDADIILPELMRVSIAGMRYQSAIRYFEDYGRQMSRQRRATFGVVAGVLFLGVEQPDEARRIFEESLRLEPNNARGQFLLAELLREEYADFAASDVHYREYLRLEPNGENAVLARAGLLKAPEEALPSESPQNTHFLGVPERTP